jgi:hypothetical protein
MNPPTNDGLIAVALACETCRESVHLYGSEMKGHGADIRRVLAELTAALRENGELVKDKESLTSALKYARADLAARDAEYLRGAKMLAEAASEWQTRAEKAGAARDALIALIHRQLALDSLSPAARALEEKAIIAEFERLRAAPAGPAPTERALRFAYEIVADELRMGYPGHDNVMVALEVVLRPEGVEATPSTPAIVSSETITGQLTHAGAYTINGEEVNGVFIAVPRQQLGAIKHLPMYQRVRIETANGLAVALADAHTRLMVAGYPDDAGLAALKVARDWARALGAPDSARKE